jgi:hypothetical protein
MGVREGSLEDDLYHGTSLNRILMLSQMRISNTGKLTYGYFIVVWKEICNASRKKALPRDWEFPSELTDHNKFNITTFVIQRNIPHSFFNTASITWNTMSYNNMNNMNNINGSWMQNQLTTANMLPVTFNSVPQHTGNSTHHYAPGQIPYDAQTQFLAQYGLSNGATLVDSQQPPIQNTHSVFNGMISAMDPQNVNSNDPFVGSNPMIGGGNNISDEEMTTLILEAQSAQQSQFNQMAMNYPPHVDQRSTILHNNQQSQSQLQLDGTNSEPEEQLAVITPPRTPRRKGNAAMARSIRNGRRTDKACDACKVS